MDNAPKSSPPQKQKWWRDRGIVVGIIGVLATIIVGVVTYWLTAGTVSREYQERAKAARNDVQAAVSRSVGEGKVPDKAKIRAVISSVERQYGIRQEDSEKPETVIDDTIERVLANEFLDAQRREELSSKLLVVRDEPAKAAEEGGPKRSASSEPKNSIAIGFAALAAGLTALATLVTGLRMTLAAPLRPSYVWRVLAPIFAVVVATLVLAAFFSISRMGQELFKAIEHH